MPLRPPRAGPLAALLAGLLLGACDGTLYDAAGVPALPPDGVTCDTGLHVCSGICVAQSPSACGAGCDACSAGAPNATAVCEPGASGAFACGQVCQPGWFGCAAGCCRATAVAAGDDHACAVTSEAGLLCWGKNDAGQLGPAAAGLLRSVRPVTVFTSGVSAVAAGGRHTCAVQGGTVQCWGANESGQLGDGSTMATATPVTTSPPLTGATRLALGASHSCAVVGVGAAAAVHCWGANGLGQLGIGTVDVEPHPSPVATLGTGGATSLSAAGDDTCAVAAGVAKCWGLDLEGQTGSGDTASPRRPKPTPVTVPLPISLAPAPAVTGPAIRVAAGRKHACANYADAGGGSPLYCWGSGGEGQMGNRSPATPVLAPVQADRIDNGALASVFVAGEAFTCSAKAGDVTMKCAGRNDQAQCGGAPSATPAVLELEVAFGGTSVAASAGRAFSCALIDLAGQRVVMCWGANAEGQLGRATPASAPSPTPDLVGG